MFQEQVWQEVEIALTQVFTYLVLDAPFAQKVVFPTHNRPTKTTFGKQVCPESLQATALLCSWCVHLVLFNGWLTQPTLVMHVQPQAF